MKKTVEKVVTLCDECLAKDSDGKTLATTQCDICRKDLCFTHSCVVDTDLNNEVCRQRFFLENHNRTTCYECAYRAWEPEEEKALEEAYALLDRLKEKYLS